MKCDEVTNDTESAAARLLPHDLRIVAWELTGRCNLSCRHCRASAGPGNAGEELSTERCLRVADEIARFDSPLVILTGGEPLLRGDILEIAQRFTNTGARVAAAVNGTLLTEGIAGRLLEAGVHRVSISLDGSTSESHDSFRGETGAFDAALRGIRAAKAQRLPFQINSSITAENHAELPALHRLALDLGASALHVFLLVNVGRGRALGELPASQYEEILRWILSKSGKSEMELKPTCAPQYRRIQLQHGIPPGPHAGRGCIAGIQYCFIACNGVIQPCGYLPVKCGSVSDEGLLKAWETSGTFQTLRDLSRYRGKCGRCEFLADCGGCRARALAARGDYMADEPKCTYTPQGCRVT